MASNSRSDFQSLPIGRIVTLAVAGIILVVGLSTISSLVEYLDGDQVMVVQRLSGQLVVYTDPGWKWQGFGKVIKFNRRNQYWFSNEPTQGGKADQSITMRFNDGAHAQLSGSIAWQVPTDETSLLRIYRDFHNQETLEHTLIEPNIEKAVYFTGPMMSSKESYAERRNDLIALIEDQIANGVYKTITEQRKEPDPITGDQKTVSYVKILETNGIQQRQEVSPIKDYGIHTSNLSINNVKYDNTVEAQIAEQQQIAMNVQKSIAEAKQAEQKAITVEKDGQAKAAQAKWDQEVVKAKFVTEGEQKVAVAKLDNDAAELYRQATLKRADADATYRQRVMQADGALAQKLDTYLKAQQVWANAFEKHQGPMVPSVVMGGGAGGTNSVNGTSTLMDMMGAKFAHDLSLDLSANTKGR